MQAGDSSLFTVLARARQRLLFSLHYKYSELIVNFKPLIHNFENAVEAFQNISKDPFKYFFAQASLELFNLLEVEKLLYHHLLDLVIEALFK